MYRMSNESQTGATSLERFVQAQLNTYARAVAELRQGRKQSHWMWYIFPQLRGLGRSATAQAYSIDSLEEAGAYLAHPVLGPRLIECTGLAIAADKAKASDIFYFPDDLKFRSCMTLFAAVPGAPAVFAAAIEKYYGGEPDAQTQHLLGC
jgi:uncharacterized protein (DUF1810 family)